MNPISRLILFITLYPLALVLLAGLICCCLLAPFVGLVAGAYWVMVGGGDD